MKKVLSLVLAIVFMFALAIPAFATDKAETNVTIVEDSNLPNFTGSTDGTTEVQYTVNGAYTVTIPATITVGEEVTENNVTASGVMLGWGQTLTVTAAYDGVLSLKVHENASDADLEYGLYVGGASEELATGGTVLTVAAGTLDGGATLSAKLDDGESATYAGNYTDTVTFTVTVTPPATQNG